MTYSEETDDGGSNLSHSQQETALKTEDNVFTKTNEPVDLDERVTQDNLDVLHNGSQDLQGRVRSNNVVCASPSASTLTCSIANTLTELDRVLLDLVCRLVDDRHNVLLVAATEAVNTGNGGGSRDRWDTLNAGHRANDGERRERRREGAEGGNGEDGETAEGEHLEKSVGAKGATVSVRLGKLDWMPMSTTVRSLALLYPRTPSDGSVHTHGAHSPTGKVSVRCG